MLRLMNISLFGIGICCSTAKEGFLATLREELGRELSVIGYTDLGEERKCVIDALMLRTYEATIDLCASRKSEQMQICVEPYGVIFSTAMNEYDQPVSNLKTIFFEDETVFVFVKWNIPIGTHDYLCKVYDASGREVVRSRTMIAAKQIDWNTWTRYRINSAVDAPGMWKFEIFLDGEKYVDEGFPVQE